MKTCHYCDSTTLDLYPYGPGSADACLPCMTASPEREETAAREWQIRYDAAMEAWTTAVETGASPEKVQELWCEANAVLDWCQMVQERHLAVLEREWSGS